MAGEGAGELSNSRESPDPVRASIQCSGEFVISPVPGQRSGELRKRKERCWRRLAYSEVLRFVANRSLVIVVVCVVVVVVVTGFITVVGLLFLL